MNNENSLLEDFFNKAKQFPYVIDAYITLQAAITFHKDLILLDDIADKIMPRPNRKKNVGASLGEQGLQLLGILFNCELLEKGMTGYHFYRFTRKEDGATVVAQVKI